MLEERVRGRQLAARGRRYQREPGPRALLLRHHGRPLPRSSAGRRTGPRAPGTGAGVRPAAVGRCGSSTTIPGGPRSRWSSWPWQTTVPPSVAEIAASARRFRKRKSSRRCRRCSQRGCAASATCAPRRPVVGMLLASISRFLVMEQETLGLANGHPENDRVSRIVPPAGRGQPGALTRLGKWAHTEGAGRPALVGSRGRATGARAPEVRVAERERLR